MGCICDRSAARGSASSSPTPDWPAACLQARNVEVLARSSKRLVVEISAMRDVDVLEDRFTNPCPQFEAT